MNIKPTIGLFFVTEEEYPKLQRLFPEEFTLTYDKWVEYIEDRFRNLDDPKSVVKTYVTIDGFLAWCAASEIEPDADARMAYAAYWHATNSA